MGTLQPLPLEFRMSALLGNVSYSRLIEKEISLFPDNSLLILENKSNMTLNYPVIQ